MSSVLKRRYEKREQVPKATKDYSTTHSAEKDGLTDGDDGDDDEMGGRKRHERRKD